jgi:hypothetical protein
MTPEINPERHAHELEEAEGLLDDALWALDYCLDALQRLGHKWDDTNSGALSDELVGWCKRENAKAEAQEQKYKAAMREKRRRRLRVVK